MNPADNYLLEHKGEIEPGCTSQEKNPTQSVIDQQDRPSSDSNALSSNDYSVDANSCSRHIKDNGGSRSCPDDAMSQSLGDHSESVSEAVKSLASPHNNVEENIEEDINIFDTGIDWTPPEAENVDDEQEHSSSVFDDDDDEEYGDGINQDKPFSFHEEFSKSPGLKEEKKRAIGEVKNGKFKGLVSQLLNSVGVADSGDLGESWVDIVTSLAWGAASYVKPNYTEGKVMDPSGLVKIKCIQTGTRSQSQLIRGLVFKKRAAHKKMPTAYKNPRLLLIRGMLGHTTGLSSLNSKTRQSQDDAIAPILKELEACRPEVILVEKSVTRNIMEGILPQNEVTFVSDMKLHRLERVAHCTGSPIVSSDSLQGQQLKQCGKLYFEKFVEEHSVAEGGKKPSKTLLFLEECPIRLGCTILLKGSCSDELKRIKCVAQCAVVMAYHFILETTFLLDQKVMFSTISSNIFPMKQQSSDVVSVDSVVSLIDETKLESAPSTGRDILINDGFQAKGFPLTDGINSETAASHSSLSFSVSSNIMTAIPRNEKLDQDEKGIDVEENVSRGMTASEGGQDRNGFHEKGTAEIAASRATGVPQSIGIHEDVSPYTTLGLEGKCSSSNGADAQKLLDTIVPSVPFSSRTVYQSVSTCFGLKKRDANSETAVITHGLPNSELPEQCDSEANNSVLHGAEAVDASKPVIDNGGSILDKYDIRSVLDAESILVLKSSRNALRGTICEQSQFSNIKFYNNFDVPLGKFLRDNLLHQSLPCKTCGEPPEAHFYYYAHHNEQLTVRVKRYKERNLPGASEGKLWMWSRCGKCKPSSKTVKSTKRVLISAAARGLSFGKFMELSFSNDSLFNRLSSCGHSLHRDFLYFFGFGSMIAMFKSSPVVKYTVSVPPQNLAFNNPVEGEWVEKETESVANAGKLLFRTIAEYLKENEYWLVDRILNLPGCPREFTHIQTMLDDESNQFHANIRDACHQDCQTAYKMLHLNRLRCDLLLEAFVWSQRLQMLLSSDPIRSSTISSGTSVEGGTDLKEDHVGGQECEPTNSARGIVPIQSPREDNQCLEIGGPQYDLHNGSDSISEIEATKGSAGIKSAQAHEGEERRTIKIKGREISDDCQSSTDVTFQIATISGATLGRGQLGIKDRRCNKSIEGFDEGNSVKFSDTTDSVQGMKLGTRALDVHSAVESMEPTSLPTNPHLAAENCQRSDVPIPDHLLADETTPIMEVRGTDLSLADKTDYEKVKSPMKWEASVWNAFSEIQKEHMKEVLEDDFLNFGYSTDVDGSFPEIIAQVYQVIMEEGSRHHIPLDDGGYVVSDYEGEISSIIACALARVIDACPLEGNKLIVNPQKKRNVDSETARGSISLLRATSEPLVRLSSRRFSMSDARQPAPGMSLEHRFSSFDGLNLPYSLSYSQMRHPEIFLGGDKYPMKSKCSVVCMYATEFRAFRNRCCPSELDYIASLSRCRIWNAKGGKSKSFFAKTLDGRLIIKGIKKTEFEAFLQFAPKYFEYMQQSVGSGNQTCLAKILGVYQVTVRQPKSGKEMKQDLMVMENLSFGRNITRQYDLKGALHSRLSAGDGSGDVLLDQNFVNDMNASPMYVGKKAKRLIQRAVWNDTPFLRGLNVMDYSLLVVIDEQRKEIVCGIIDYLRQYTWDKQLENWVKSSLVVPKNLLPTIISPDDYMKRFRKFMDIHFLTVPDNWCSHRSSNPCKLCGIKGQHSRSHTEPKNQDEPNGF